MKALKTMVFILLGCLPFCCLQVNMPKKQDMSEYMDHSERTFFRFMFYNVENLFDPFDDSTTNDDEFLPFQHRYWTWSKFQDKINKLYKVIISVGGWHPPEMIGVCEIENAFVLNELVNKTPFAVFEYEYIHQDSPDDRGIDVALLYDPEKFLLLENAFIPVSFPFDPESKTRDILYAKGIINGQDTLHVLVNHWPSRLGGQLESESKRIHAARHLKRLIDSILTGNRQPNIIITGDFNDYPHNSSLTGTLGARFPGPDIRPHRLYNLALPLQQKGLGTHKYRERWGMLDQFMVSGNLLNPDNAVHCTREDVHVFNAGYLLEDDEKYLGKKTYRTYLGYRYIGGYSDHLPVYLDIRKKQVAMPQP